MKELEIEQKLYGISERMVQIRHDMQTGRMNTQLAQDELDTLQTEYLTLKNTSEDTEPDYSEPDYSDYVTEEDE